jgi:hypothetical protein
MFILLLDFKTVYKMIKNDVSDYINLLAGKY